MRFSRTNRARTRPDHPDPALRGRRYGIPFQRVWDAALKLAGGGLRGWSLVSANDQVGLIVAESTTLVFRFVDDVEIRITLDEDAQTRVDLSSASRVGNGDWGTNARRIRGFLRSLDRTVGADAATILPPEEGVAAPR